MGSVTESRAFIANEDQADSRLDSTLSELFPDTTRSQWKKLIESEQVLVEGQTKPAKYILKTGDSVTILPVQKIKLEQTVPIIYEDKNILVIDKPIGMLVHAKDKLNGEETLVDYFSAKIHEEDGYRKGIVHRLDRETSGVMVIAKTTKFKETLQKQFKQRSVQKKYVALVSGNLKQKEAVIRWPIERNPKNPALFRVGKNGKVAETSYRVLEENGKFSLLECSIKTGRTHQIRVHLAHLGHPVVGDKFYKGTAAERLMLHSACLKLQLSDKNMEFKSPVPPIFNKLLKNVS